VIGLAEVAAYATVAGLAIPAGGLIARIERVQPDWLEQELRHGVLAFGGGVLIAAVALVLVPEGIRHLPVWGATGALLAGGLAFMAADRALARRGTPASMLLAALLDFLPEALALGAAFTVSPAIGPLLAFFIALQNLPEGFNAYREMVVRGRMRPGRVLGLFLALVPLGPVFAGIGLLYLAGYERATALIMLAASGGILYLVFQDIAPQARLRRHWAPPLGAVLGFALGLAGHMLLGS
jgi:ZIP family zinc transporter